MSWDVWTTLSCGTDFISIVQAIFCPWKEISWDGAGPTGGYETVAISHIVVLTAVSVGEIVLLLPVCWRIS